MARTISKEGLEQKIEKVQIAIARNREQYDKLTEEWKSCIRSRKRFKARNC